MRGRAMWLRLGASGLAGLCACAPAPPIPAPAPPAARAPYVLAAEDDALLEDLSRRSFRFFWEHADPQTGIIRDRARTDGSPTTGDARDVGSIAAVGFGLSGLCIAAERGWQPRPRAVERARTTLRFFGERAYHNRGWFYHFINVRTGEREWRSELSSIDTALLLAGVLTVRRCFAEDPEVSRLAGLIYRRVDFRWMLDGHPTLLSHGWRPETGFLNNRWDHYSELMILYVLGLGSPTTPLPAASWAAWRRPLFTYDELEYVHTVPPLFIHQYAHAWVDFRKWRDPIPPQPDWFENAALATLAQKQFLLSLAGEFPGYSENVWGLTSSDSPKGYVAWGGPPRHPATDGSVVPCAPSGSLMLAPEITVPVVRELRRRFGGRIYGVYGFADTFHPTSGWVNPDVIGIDLGITLLGAENLRTGRVWRWFMGNPEIERGLRRGGLTPAA